MGPALYEVTRGAHYLLNCFQFKFKNDFQIYKIFNNKLVVQNVKLYKFGQKSLWLIIEHNNQWSRFSLNITRKVNYIKDGETKVGSCSNYLNLTVAQAIVDRLPLAYQLAKNLQDNKGVKIYNIFCLIFEICYTFQQRSAAMTAIDSVDRMLVDIAAACRTTTRNIANFVLDGCRLTNAKADLQRFRNL